MTQTLLAGIRETQSRLTRDKQIFPRFSNRAATPEGRAALDGVIKTLTGEGAGLVVSYLRAHGVIEAKLAEKKIGGLELTLISDSNLPRLTQVFNPLSVKTEEMAVLINPDEPPSATELEHQCWQLYLNLNCVFPQFRREIDLLRTAMSQSNYHSLCTWFLDSLADCYLRSAALYAERDEFVKSDTTAGLSRDLAYLDKLSPSQRRNYFNLTAAIAGITLGHALPFYFDHRFAYLHFNNQIRAFFEPWFKRDKNLPRIFERAVDLSARCYAACFNKGQEPLAEPCSLLTEGFGNDLWDLWQAHIKQYFWTGEK